MWSIRAGRERLVACQSQLDSKEQKKVQIVLAIPRFLFILGAMKYKNLPSSLRMASNESNVASLVIRDGDNTVEAKLFMVSLTRPRQGRSPIVSQYFVIAEDGDGAIAQVADNAFPECDYAYDLRDSLECSAVRVPLHVRGWGNDTF